MSENFKGWHVLAGGWVNAVLIAGAAIYAFGLFVAPIEKEFGLTREQVYWGISGLYVSMMIWAVLVGRWLEKYSAKTFAILGGLAFGLGYLLIGTAQHWAVILAAVMLPLGFAVTAAGPFLINALAARWFEQKRGRALGIAAVATSVGGLIVVPVFGTLITHFGWRKATLIFAVFISLIVVLIASKFIISRPEDIGQIPDGVAKEENISATVAPTTKFINRSQFWFISFAVGLLIGSDQALLASLIPYGLDRGFSVQAASNLMIPMTASAIAGKLVVGWLAERYDKRMLFVLVCFSNIAFLIAVLLAPSYWQLIAIASVVGLAIGGVYPVWTTITAECFGRQNFAKTIGAMNLITVPGILISLIIAGRTYDQTGDYNLAFKIFIAQVIVAAVLIMFVRTPKS